MGALIDFGDPTTNEGCLSGHYWSGSVCTRCRVQLRCGACGRFVTIDNLDRHVNDECPIKWDEYEANQPEGAA